MVNKIYSNFQPYILIKYGVVLLSSKVYCVYINFIVIHLAVMDVMYDAISDSHVERSEKGTKVIKCYHQQTKQSSALP